MKSDRQKRVYFKEVRLRQLRAIVELSGQRSFARTAAALGLSTPSIWQQVRALESEFGASLLRVQGKRVELTEDGKQLAELAAPIVKSFESLKAVFLDRRGKLPRQLTVATTASLCANELRGPLETYRRLYPNVRLTLLDRPSAAARALFEQGEADIAVVGELAAAGKRQAHAATRLTAYPFMLLCPSGHPLLGRRRLSLADLSRHPLVLSGEGTNSRTRVHDVFQAAGLNENLNVAMSASSLALLAVYVSMGFGVSISSVSPAIIAAARAGKADYAGLQFRDLTRLFGEERVIVLARQGRLELPHVRAFHEILSDGTDAPP